MESRMEKYYKEDNSNMQRSSKNARLYREVYQDYNSLENLPIPDNTNEIDIPQLRKIVQSQKQDLTKTREMKYQRQDVIEKEKKDSKIYDINKLLEYAKNENNKLKDNNFHHEQTSNYRLLQTLENKAITKSDLESELIENRESSDENNTDLSKELKYQTMKISENPSIEQIITHDNTSSLSLDILSDLKPTGNTGVTEPIQDPMFEKIYNEDTINDTEDTRDIDIIKEKIDTEDDEKKTLDQNFYTDTYKFSNRDFDDDDEDEPKNHYVLKIILLIIFILICGAAIFYFVTNYGLN